MLDRLEDAYQDTVLRGVATAAEQFGLNLLFFAGGVLRSPHRSAAQRNVVHDLAGPDNVDGLLVLAGSIGYSAGTAELARYCQRYQPLPMCSVAVELPGMPSVVVDNTSGMRQGIEHLIDAHDCQRIAFIRGPEANHEAELRFSTYRDVLAARQLAYDPELVTIGDFQREAGIEAVRLFVDERRLSLDAIVAADDATAFGVMDGLQQRGIRIPYDVAVVGFDDVEEARFTTPPLTTIRQPLFEQGRRAVELVVAQIRGQAVPHHSVALDTKLVVRSSCGCPPVEHLQLPSDEPPQPELSFEDDLAGRWSQIIATVTEATDDSFATLLGADWAERLLDAFVANLRQQPTPNFVGTLEVMLQTVLLADVNVSQWQTVLTRLRAVTLPALVHHPTIRGHAEELWHLARLLVASAIERAQARQQLQANRLSRILSETSEALITTFDVTSLLGALSKQLPRLSIPSCFLCLYEQSAQDCQRGRLILSYPARRNEPQNEQPFAAGQLLPRNLWPTDRRYTYVIEPLFFEDEQLGYVLLEMGPTQGLIYEVLRDQLSAALEGALLVQRVVDKDEQRQRLLRYIVDVTPDMHRVQPPVDLVNAILGHSARLLDAQDCFLAMLPDAEEGEDLFIRAGTGRFTAQQHVDHCVDPDELEAVREALRRGEIRVTEVATILPLKVGELSPGVIYLERPTVSAQQRELLKIFSHQATAAIHNSSLYEMAALDQLTGVAARRFFERWLLRELRSAMRLRLPLSLLMVDVDDMKSINDTAGHLAGDRALAALGRVLRKATRDTDVVGRYGGDEFAVLLPQTDTSGSEQVAQRILALLENVTVAEPGHEPIPLGVSIGLSTLIAHRFELSETTRSIPTTYFRDQSRRLLQRADDAVYAAKRNGGNRLHGGLPTDWLTLSVRSSQSPVSEYDQPEIEP